MGHSGYISLLDVDFLDIAFQQFGSLEAALNELRELGHPTPASSYSPQVHKIPTILRIFAAIIRAGFEEPGPYDTRVDIILQRWTPSIVPWIMFLLENVLFDGSFPLTSEGLKTIDHTLSFSPFLLSYLPNKAQLKRQIHSYPPLYGLLVQALCKAVDINHSSWMLWATELVKLAFTHDKHELDTPVTDMTAGLYKNDPALAMIFVRHITHHASRIPKMELWELYAFKALLSCLEAGVCFPGPDTLLKAGNVREYSIPGLVRILSVMFKKRRALHQPTSDEDEVVIPQEVAITALGHLYQLVDLKADGPYWVSKAIDCGIITTIMKAPWSFFHPDARIMAISSEMKGYYARAAVPIFSRIAVYLIYPSVLHSFWPVLQKVVSREDLEDDLRLNSDELWDMWCTMKRKAGFFHGLLRAFKQDPSFMCSHLNCPLAQTRPNDGGTSFRARYLRCSSCMNVTYCSRSCQKLDWKTTHRTGCQHFTAARLAGIRDPSHHEYRFIQRFLEIFVKLKRSYILSLLESHRRQLVAKPYWTRSLNERLIMDGRVQPPISIVFVTPGVPTAEECIKVLDLDSLFSKWCFEASPDAHVTAMYPGGAATICHTTVKL